MIIYLASYPRSGNTLFRITMKQVYGMDSYSAYNDADITRMGAADVVGHKQLFTHPDVLRRKRRQFFVKTHNMGHNSFDPAICIVRDGRDAILSHAHYRKDVEQCPKSLEEIMMDLIVSNPLFGGWSRNIASWLNRKHSTVLVKYEDMLLNPANSVFLALSELQIPLGNTQGSVPSFEELHAEWPKFFRSGRAGSWITEMSDKVHEAFLINHGAMLRSLGYV